MLTRLYSIADADLKQLADALANSITRDIADFGTRNIDTRTVDELRLLTTTFDDASTDQELLGLVMDATAIKDTIAENTRKAIRAIRNMAELAFNSKGLYNTFGFDDMANMSDSELCTLAKRVFRVGNRLMAQMEPQGLTAATLAALQTLRDQLDNALDNINEAVENRDIETQQRVMKGNALWQEMSRLASIGKSLYEDTNEAKFNDYVLIGSSTPAAEKPKAPAQG
jgi:hypothetical protein